MSRAYNAAHDDAGKNRRRPQNPLLGPETPVHPSSSRSNRPASRGEVEAAAAAPRVGTAKLATRLQEPCTPSLAVFNLPSLGLQSSTEVQETEAAVSFEIQYLGLGLWVAG